MQRRLYTTLWQRFTNLLPRSAKTDPAKPPLTISPTATHSLSALTKDATHAAYLARCASCHRLSLRTPFLRYSAQKLQQVARLLPGLTLEAALAQMQFQARKGARLACIPLLRDAINAARQRLKEPGEWAVLEAMVGRGRYRRRLDIKGRGRIGIIRRPSCFLRIVVGAVDREAALRRRLLRFVNRSMRKMVRDDKPAYLPLRY